MNRGLITIAKDNFVQRFIDPLFAGMFSQKQLSTTNTDRSLQAWLSLVTGFDGTAIDPDNAFSQIAANKRNIHASVKLIGNALATTPLRVYKPKTGDSKSYKITKVRDVPEAQKQYLFSKATPGSPLAVAGEIEEIVGGHPLVKLLRNVSGNVDNFGLKFMSATYMSLTGDNYWVLLKNGLKLPASIWIAPAEYMKPIPKSRGEVAGYQYKRGLNKEIFAEEDVVHFRLYAPGANYQFVGRGDTAGAADAFNLTQAIQIFEQKIFKNGATLGGVLSTSTRHTEEQQKKILRQFQDGHAGVTNAGKWMVMENVEPKSLMLTPRELDYQDSRETLMQEMLRNFSIPEALMTGQTSTRAGLEASLTQLALFVTAVYCTLMTEALNAQLAPLYPGDLIIAFDNPVMEDKAFQLKRDMMDLKMGKKTIDELRIRDGEKPFGGLASEPLIDANRIPLSMAGQVQPQQQTEQEMRASVNRVMDLVRADRMGG